MLDVILNFPPQGRFYLCTKSFFTYFLYALKFQLISAISDSMAYFIRVIWDMPALNHSPAITEPVTRRLVRIINLTPKNFARERRQFFNYCTMRSIICVFVRFYKTTHQCGKRVSSDKNKAFIAWLLNTGLPKFSMIALITSVLYFFTEVFSAVFRTLGSNRSIIP
jgi:hypothetical protein